MSTLKELRAWRKAIGGGAERVAVICGTFHMLQPGNLTAVRLAKRYSGHLCVILEPDCSSAAKEHAVHSPNTRPAVSLSERLEMVSHLKDVDLVTSCHPTLSATRLECLRPYTWVYCKKQIDGKMAARASELADCRVSIPPIPGCFTPEILEAIRKGRTPIHIPSLSLGNRPVPVHKSSGRIIVTANGCFDVLHIGHLRFLSQARAMGDELTVLINNDASVRRYKGATRPIFPLKFRKTALLSLKSVTSVRSFHEDNPLRLIEQLKPNVHVKGGSYDPARVDGERELLK
ncbi:MAG: adenylyltransferase/cytidyltransferase family protein, partial [bacterium]